MADIKEVITGVLYFFYGVIFTAVTYYILPPFVDLLTDTVLQGIFWVGLITMWIMAIVVFPVVKIMKGMKA